MKLAWMDEQVLYCVLVCRVVSRCACDGEDEHEVEPPIARHKDRGCEELRWLRVQYGIGYWILDTRYSIFDTSRFYRRESRVRTERQHCDF